MSLSAEVLKLVPAAERKAFARRFLVQPEQKIDLQFRPVPLPAPHLPPQVDDEVREISMRFMSGQQDELTALEKLFLALLKLPNQMPLQDPLSETVSTMHEGRVKYVPMWNFFVRADRTARVMSDNFFKNVPMRRAPEMIELRKLVLSVRDEAFVKSLKTYSQYYRIWKTWTFLRDNSDPGLNKFIAYANGHPMPRREWYSAQWHLEMWRREGVFYLGACNHKSVLFATLLLACGVDPWRIGIFTSRYAPDPNDPELTTPTHVFVGVYLFDTWRFLDATYLHAGYEPGPFARSDTGIMRANIGSIPHCDYAHPFSAEYPQSVDWPNFPEIRIKSVPLLSAQPYMLINTPAWQG